VNRVVMPGNLPATCVGSAGLCRRARRSEARARAARHRTLRARGDGRRTPFERRRRPGHRRYCPRQPGPEPPSEPAREPGNMSPAARLTPAPQHPGDSANPLPSADEVHRYRDENKKAVFGHVPRSLSRRLDRALLELRKTMDDFTRKRRSSRRFFTGTRTRATRRWSQSSRRRFAPTATSYCRPA
jgi:hypothetical protein